MMFERELLPNGEIDWSELLNDSIVQDTNLSDLSTEEFVEKWQNNNLTADLWFPAKPPSNFTADSFFEKKLVRDFHSYPRFGKNRDIANLFKGSEDYTPPETKDYKMGLFIMVILLWLVLIIWAILLAYCKYKNKLGWLSGRAPKKPLSPSVKASQAPPLGEASGTSDDSGGLKQSAVSAMSMTEYTEKVNRVETRVKWCRITVLVSGLIILVFSGLLIGIAFMSLDNTLHATWLGLPSIYELTGAMHNFTHRFLVASNETEDARIAFFDSINETCPTLEQEEIRETNVTILEAFYFLNDTLNATRAFLYPEIFNISDTLKNVTESLESVHSTLGSMQDWWVPLFSSFVIVYDLMVVMFMVGVILAWIDKQNRIFRDYSTKFVLPVFIFVLIVLYVIATFGLILTALSSDFCIDTPDKQVLRIIDAPFPFDRVVEWYIYGCRDEDYPLWFFLAIRLLLLLGKAITAFLGEISKIDPASLNVFCGQDASLLVSSAGFLEAQLTSLGDLLISVASALKCVDINVIYTHMAYTTLCSHAVQGAMELFIFLIVIAFFSMVIVTLRIAWYEIEAEPDEMEMEEMAAASNEQWKDDFEDNEGDNDNISHGVSVASGEDSEKGVDQTNSFDTNPNGI